MNYYKNDKGGCLLTHEVDGNSVWFEVMTFEQYQCAKITNPFCLELGGRLYCLPFRTYVNSSGETQYVYDDKKVFVLIDKE